MFIFLFDIIEDGDWVDLAIIVFFGIIFWLEFFGNKVFCFFFDLCWDVDLRRFDFDLVIFW